MAGDNTIEHYVPYKANHPIPTRALISPHIETNHGLFIQRSW